MPRPFGVTRAALCGWLDTLGVGGEATLLVQHAVGELVTNAVEHAFAHQRVPMAIRKGG
jgi:anti-sigma regulatory factor (Ser/Thr protein kinase)